MPTKKAAGKPSTKARKGPREGASDVEAVGRELVAALRARGRAERAEKERAYLKSDLDHLGVSVPETRATLKELWKTHRLSADQALTLAEQLYDLGIYEPRLAGALWLERVALTGDQLPRLEALIRRSKTWALVDPLAVHVLGKLVVAEPALNAELDRWILDDDFWIRRSAMLALLGPLRRGGGDWDRFVRYADDQLDDKEFFIRKTIGWILREVARKRPQLVIGFIAPRTHRASGVTMREVVKPLDEATRERLMAAYREKRACT
ncbi:MAG: DNA alkylation repair protein [Polyangiaceae bacterium]